MVVSVWKNLPTITICFCIWLHHTVCVWNLLFYNGLCTYTKVKVNSARLSHWKLRMPCPQLSVNKRLIDGLRKVTNVVTSISECLLVFNVSGVLLHCIHKPPYKLLSGDIVSETQLYSFAANANSNNDQSYNYILQIIDLVWREIIII